MKYFSLIILLVAMNCSVPKNAKTTESNLTTEKSKKKEKKNNQLLVVLNNPKKIADAKALITNSGLQWKELDLKAKGVKAALVEVPLDKKKFWLQRLSESRTFEQVTESNDEVITNLKTELQNRLISIKTTPCFGDCPVYQLYVTKNGKVLYKGKENVVVPGVQEFQLSDKELKLLVAKINKSDFDSFKDSYDNPRITDLPSTYIFCDGKQIEIRLWKNIPDDLIDVHEYITGFLYDKKFLE